MDRDLLMVNYGALIGLGSSIITTLFQSWIKRREQERQRKEAKRRELQSIQIPSTQELIAIRNGEFAKENGRVIIKRVAEAPPEIIPSPYKYLILIVFLIVCSGVVYLIFWIDNPILYSIIVGFIVFCVTYIFLKFRLNS